MSYRTYLLIMGGLSLAATGCSLLAPLTAVGPNGEPSAAADAGGALIDSVIENPSWTGVINGAIAAVVVIAGAYTGKRAYQKRRAQA